MAPLSSFAGVRFFQMPRVPSRVRSHRGLLRVPGDRRGGRLDAFPEPLGRGSSGRPEEKCAKEKPGCPQNQKETGEVAYVRKEIGLEWKQVLPSGKKFGFLGWL